MQGFGLTFREEKGAQMTPTELLTTAEPYKGALCSVLLSLVLPKNDTVQALEFTGLSPPHLLPLRRLSFILRVLSECQLRRTRWGPSGAFTLIRQAGTVIPSAHRSPLLEGMSRWGRYHGTMNE